MQEDGPRWTDSLTNKRGGYRWYQLTDSIFWRWEEKNMLLWKIGETAHEMKISRKNEGCSHSSKIERRHQWLDGTFIALGGNLSAGEDSCQYAVLDTISGTLTYKRLDKNLEWIKVCDDVRAWDDDVYFSRLEEEFWTLREVGNKIEQPMADYFITMSKIIDICWNEAGSLVGPSRGSAGVILINYLLDITQMNPIKMDLPFVWRFMHPSRPDYPD